MCSKQRVTVMRAFSLLTMLCAFCACAAEPRELLVFAAVSTAEAVTEVTAAFEREHPGVKVRTTFAGTNELLRQLRAGAKGELFLSADEASIHAVTAVRRTLLLSNRLVVVVPLSSNWTALVPTQLPALRRIAVADPQSVPAGRYAKAWLEQQAVWSAIQDKLVPSLDVRAALAAAEAGRVDASIVYATDAAHSKKVREVLRAGDDAGIVYGLAQVKDSVDAAALFDFFKGPAARSAFERHGFLFRVK